MKNQEIKPGDLVQYQGQNGKVKSLTADGENAYVCYSCNGDWDRVHLYTGQLTPINKLTIGWKEPKV
jgi:hypothetical protein